MIMNFNTITQSENGYIVTQGDVTMSVPNDPENRHYKMVQADIKAGAKVLLPPKPEFKMPDLSPAKWNFLLDVTDTRVVLDGVLAAMPKDTMEERIAWASLRATALDAKTFRWEKTLELVRSIRKQGVKGIPTDKELKEAWMLASKFEGA